MSEQPVLVKKRLYSACRADFYASFFSYGYRPFFPAASFWLIIQFGFWLPALFGGADITGVYGPFFWHAHEMLFGFGGAVLAGFLLTSIPNWTGTLPITGLPLALLFILWLAGRIAMSAVSIIPTSSVIILDSLFLPVSACFCIFPVLVSRKWRDMKVIAGLLVLTCANICFHSAAFTGDFVYAARMAISALVILMIIVAGRMIPAYMRQWMEQKGYSIQLPRHGVIDTTGIAVSIAVLGLWTFDQSDFLLSVLAMFGAILHLLRLIRWKAGNIKAPFPVMTLSAGYLFITLGFAGLCLVRTGLFSQAGVVHLFVIGAMNTMMLAVMIRVIQRYQGQPVEATRLTVPCFPLVWGATIIRLAADYTSFYMLECYVFSSALLMLAWFLFFLNYYTPARPRQIFK